MKVMTAHGHEDNLCPKCEGCGKVANDEEGTPWTFWASLRPGEGLAVQIGAVVPIICPECKGSGKDPNPQETVESTEEADEQEAPPLTPMEQAVKNLAQAQRVINSRSGLEESTLEEIQMGILCALVAFGSLVLQALQEVTK